MNKHFSKGKAISISSYSHDRIGGEVDALLMDRSLGNLKTMWMICPRSGRKFEFFNVSEAK